MAKDLSKSVKQPMAMQAGAKNMEAMAASPNMKGSAYEAPLMNNKMREAQKHMGGVPAKNANGYQ